MKQGLIAAFLKKQSSQPQDLKIVKRPLTSSLLQHWTLFRISNHRPLLSLRRFISHLLAIDPSLQCSFFQSSSQYLVWIYTEAFQEIFSDEHVFHLILGNQSPQTSDPHRTSSCGKLRSDSHNIFHCRLPFYIFSSVASTTPAIASCL